MKSIESRILLCSHFIPRFKSKAFLLVLVYSLWELASFIPSSITHGAQLFWLRTQSCPIFPSSTTTHCTYCIHPFCSSALLPLWDFLDFVQLLQLLLSQQRLRLNRAGKRGSTNLKFLVSRNRPNHHSGSPNLSL